MDATISKKVFWSASTVLSAVQRSVRKKRLKTHPRIVSSWFPRMPISSAPSTTSISMLSGPNSLRLAKNSLMSMSKTLHNYSNYSAWLKRV
jgi:hypothetical protein